MTQYQDMEGNPQESGTLETKHGQTTSPPKVHYENNSDAKFKYKIGMILSCVGCMVGTGNIWRFPRIAANNSGENGALQFLLVWGVFLFLWSIPMIVIEYATGRYVKKAPVLVYKELLGPKNMWCGGWILIVDLGITCYYSVVLGWCFYYLFYTIAHPLPLEEAVSQAIFDDFVKDSYWSILTHGIAITLAGIAVLWGVKSIELVNSIIVPIFLVLILVSFIWSVTLPNAGKGIKYLFTPDWHEMTNPQLWVDAASQNAWDTGAGMGLFIAYAGYMSSSNGIVRFSYIIPVCNNIVSLICGMMTVATVFSVQTERGANQTEIVHLLRYSGEANTGLTFIWVPILYSTMHLGRILAVVFFLALSFAGFSSIVSNIELMTKALVDLGIKRKYSVLIVVVCVFSFGCISAVHLDFLVNQDFVWGFALLVSGVLFQYLVIRYGATTFRAKLINDYSISDWYLPKLWEWIVKYVAPIEAMALVIWFTVDEVTQDGETWYSMGTTTLMSCLVQWLLTLLILNLANVLYVYWYLPRNIPYEDLDLVNTRVDGTVAMHNDRVFFVDLPNDNGEETIQ
ncbi:putative sodium-dependent transporter YhdH [Glandiceps talaboti]